MNVKRRNEKLLSEKLEVVCQLLEQGQAGVAYGTVKSLVQHARRLEKGLTENRNAG